MIEYGQWLEEKYDDLSIEWAESGAAQELDSDFDQFCEDKYEKLLKNIPLDYVNLYKENEELKKVIQKYENLIKLLRESFAGKILLNEISHNVPIKLNINKGETK